MWPIIGAFSQIKTVPLFLIGRYTGHSTPCSICEFVFNFASEVKVLQDKGIAVGPNKVVKPFRKRLFSCDAPARSFISGTIGHTGKHGCSKCCPIGTKPYKSGILFESEIKGIRTNDSFENRLHPDHHLAQFKNAKSSLKTIGIKMVSQIS